ncbi:hypothetical protein DL770_010877 [Monosporascus sp. CRB-9-2]|nr:hypothetical protein DL770_010877 [Monosporascus sp. CRB-9-2]
MCDKFAFFGLSGPLQNYLQNSRDDPLRPGVIGLGQAGATAVNQMFMPWCFITPIAGAVVADQYLGTLRTIMGASAAYVVGLLILITSSGLEPGPALAGLLLAMVFIGIGTGGIRPNVNSLVAEQYKPPSNPLRKLPTGEIVYVDLDTTLQRIFMTFLLLVNLGSLSSALTTTIEQKYGFTAAFSLPAVAFIPGSILLLVSRHVYVVRQPAGSVVLHAIQVLGIAFRNGRRLDVARSSQLPASTRQRRPWTDSFVDEVRTALSACKLFLFLPFFWSSYSQMLTNFVSQAATMETSGIPNDILVNVDPMTIIIFIPVLEYGVFPLLRRFGIIIHPVKRIVFGYVLASLGLAYAAVVQAIIYSSPPCYEYPRARHCHGGELPNQVHVAVQMPAYILIGLSEILISVTGLEYAFTHAPPSMKSFIMSLFISTYAVGSVIALAITPFAADPNMVWVYAILGLQTSIAGYCWNRSAEWDTKVSSSTIEAEEQSPLLNSPELSPIVSEAGV